MTLISGKHLCRILITLNAIALFWIVGAPKMYINEFHFHEARLPQYYELTEVYIPREDMTFRTVEGENISVPAGSSIYRKLDNHGYLNAQFDAIMNNEPEPEMNGYFEIRVGEKGPKLDVNRAVFDDREKFEDISEKVRNEIYNDYCEKRAQEDKEYRDYLFRQHFWILFPQNSTYKYVKALIAGLIAAAIGFFFYKLKKERYLGLNIVYFLMIGFKVAVLVYVLMFPATCA